MLAVLIQFNSASVQSKKGRVRQFMSGPNDVAHGTRKMLHHFCQDLVDRDEQQRSQAHGQSMEYSGPISACLLLPCFLHCITESTV